MAVTTYSSIRPVTTARSWVEVDDFREARAGFWHGMAWHGIWHGACRTRSMSRKAGRVYTQYFRGSECGSFFLFSFRAAARKKVRTSVHGAYLLYVRWMYVPTVGTASMYSILQQRVVPRVRDLDIRRYCTHPAIQGTQKGTSPRWQRGCVDC